MRTMKKKLLFILLLLISGISAEVNATYYYVINVNDSGSGSLRQAIIDANAASGASSLDPHIIIYDLLGGGTISLASELPPLNNYINIEGNMVTVAAGNGFRVFTVNATFTVNLFRMILKDGNPSSGGGAIFNQGQLKLDEVTIKSNRVTGVAQGGAIFNSATGNLIVRKSTLSANADANVGGGIVNYGNATIENSTLYGNSANEGGAITNYKSLYVFNSTIANNQGGGIQHIVDNNVLFFLNALVVGNSGGLDLYSDVAASITADNCLFGTKDALVSITGSNNITATAAAVFGTNVLTNNGGYTETIKLTAGSPSIDAGQTFSSASTDQIGQSRNGAYDIGALEYTVTTANVNRLSEDAIKIYDNPGQGLFEIELGEGIQGTVHWKVMDRNGRLVASSDSFIKEKGVEVKTIDISKQAQGSYLLILSTEKGMLTKSLIKL